MLLYPASAAGEDFLAARENIVERILKVCRGFSELLSDLIHELLIALLDLFFEELLERAVTQSFFFLLWEV